MRPIVALALCLIACADDSVDGPRIDRVSPDPVPPGAFLRLDGENFGVEEGRVAVGGRPVQVVGWGPARAEVLLPADLAGGSTYVVVVAGGRPSLPAPLTVLGDPGPLDPPRRFPPAGDGGPRDGGVIDVRTPDAALPRGPAPGGPVLVGRFDPDPVGRLTVHLDERVPREGQLRLAVRLPDAVPAFGVALHLTYDPNLLRFCGADEAASRTFFAAEIAPGRVAIGRVRPSADAATLRFALVGPGQGRIDLPPRRRSLRGADNRPLPNIEWAGGSVRVDEAAP